MRTSASHIELPTNVPITRFGRLAERTRLSSTGPPGLGHIRTHHVIQRIHHADHRELPDPLLAKRDDKGATAVEYGLMVALIAVAIIGTVGALGGRLNTLFTQISGAL